MRTWREAEDLAAEWMRYLGYDDAAITGGAADGGLDVVATGAVAQVKWQGAAVGRPAVQRLVGAAPVGTRAVLFFSWSGYSKGAIEYANERDVALFDVDATDTLTTLSRAADSVLDRSEAVQHRRAAEAQRRAEAAREEQAARERQAREEQEPRRREEEIAEAALRRQREEQFRVAKEAAAQGLRDEQTAMAARRQQREDRRRTRWAIARALFGPLGVGIFLLLLAAASVANVVRPTGGHSRIAYAVEAGVCLLLGIGLIGRWWWRRPREYGEVPLRASRAVEAQPTGSARSVKDAPTRPTRSAIPRQTLAEARVRLTQCQSRLDEHRAQVAEAQRQGRPFDAPRAAADETELRDALRRAENAVKAAAVRGRQAANGTQDGVRLE